MKHLFQGAFQLLENLLTLSLFLMYSPLAYLSWQSNQEEMEQKEQN
jgi:hypothetical protein